MGSFFGGLLAEKGLDVVLIDVWQVFIVPRILHLGFHFKAVFASRIIMVTDLNRSMWIRSTNPASGLLGKAEIGDRLHMYDVNNNL